MNTINDSKTKTRIPGAAIGLLVWVSLITLYPVETARAGSIFTWVGAAGDNLLQNTNNWNPLLTTLPSSSANDTLQWNGSVAGNLVLTNSSGGTFDANPGFFINVAGTQVGAVTLVESNGFTGRIRLNGTNTFNSASGAGAFSFGNGGTVGFPIALAGRGNGEVHNFTNNSANPVNFNTDVYWVMGGGGAHTMLLAGTGDFNVNVTFQPQNSAVLGLTVSGPGKVNLVGAPNSAGIVTPGTFGSVTLNGGTLSLGAADAVGIGNTIVLTGGNLDSSVPDLVNSGNNLQSWNGNFGFAGTENLDLGYGPVTMNGNRIVTVNAKTLTVHGGIAGNNFSLTKAGAGTLALTGFNTYTGGTIVSNGVLQLGQPGVIPAGSSTAESVTVAGGGTLDLNGNSPLISSLNGAGIVDTTSGDVMLTVGDFDASGNFSGSINNTAGSLSLSKIGTGALTLSGPSAYTGGTMINSGTVMVNNTTGSGTGSGAVTVSSGATFGGSGTIAGSVEWQAGSSAVFVQGSPMTVNGSVTLNGNPVTVNIPGSLPLGAGVYPLMTYNNSGSSGTFQSTTPNFTGAGVSAGSSVSITTAAGTVSLVVGAPPGLTATWTNNGNGNWSVPANWSSNPQIPHLAGDVANIGLGSSFTTVTLDIPVASGFVSFNNTNSFAIANAGNTLTFDNTNGGAALIVVNGTSNSIAAPVSLNDNLAVSAFPGSFVGISGNIGSTSPGYTLNISSGSGTVALSGNNTYGPAAGSVGTTISGSGTSTLELGNNNALSAGDLSIMRSSTIRAAIDLNLANNIVISNTVATSVDDNGKNVTLSGVISGGGALNKNGAGTMILNGANSYNGDTGIGGGTLKLGNAGAVPGNAGNGNVNMGANTLLDLNGFSPVLNGLNASVSSATVDSLAGGAVTLTLGESGSFATFLGNIKNSSGSIALVKDGAGNQTLAGTNTYSGGTTINSGLLRVGNGDTNPSAGLGTGPVAIVDSAATLEFNLVGTNTFTNSISGAGQLQLANNNLNLILVNSNSFSGTVNVLAGSLWIKNGKSLGAGPKNVNVSNGTAGNSQLHLDGSAGNITTDPNIDFYLSNVSGNLFNEAGSNTISGNIYLPYGGGAAYVISKSGFLTMSGNLASDGVANGRILQLGGPGNGLFSGGASDNAQTLGGITKVDSGTWTVSGVSTTIGTLNANGGKLIFTGQWVGGPAAVNSGGTLVGSGLVSNLTVNVGGKFVPGDFGSVGTFTVSNLMTLSGAMYVSINKSLSQPNSKVVVINTGATNLVANSGSSVVISNLGPNLVTGDTFQLFNQGVTNGDLVTITGPTGVQFTNNLAVDGSISVLSAGVTNPTNITSQVVGNQLIVSWPADHTGWHLQVQTNSLAVGLGSNWFTIPGTEAGNSFTNDINKSNGAVFYRLISP